MASRVAVTKSTAPRFAEKPASNSRTTPLGAHVPGAIPAAGALGVAWDFAATPVRAKLGTGVAATKRSRDGSVGSPGRAQRGGVRRPAPQGAHPDVLARQADSGNRAASRLRQSGAGDVAPIVAHVLKSGGGRPLDPATREYMESRLGVDLSRVRVHTDVGAADSAASLSSRAYTVGTDVVFAMGEYDPHSRGGRYLLAHELAHVVQQSPAIARTDVTEAPLGATDSLAEAAARRAADAVLQPTHGPSNHAGRLAMRAAVGALQVQRQPESSLQSAGLPIELQSDINRIKDELDSLVYTEGVEERVIGILRRWAAAPGSVGYLDWIFDGLQMPKPGVFGDTTYYDAMLDDFKRADEVRAIRDGTRRYRRRESAKETRRRTEEKAERRETDIAADVTGGWTENAAEPYELAPTPENLVLAALEVRRLAKIPSERLLPIERVASEMVSKGGAKVLLRRVHFVTESERIERRRAQARAIAEPLLETLLWVTAEQLAALAVEAVVARLFVAEARAATSIVSIDVATGEIVATGGDVATGEVVTVRMNIDTGAGFATRTNGETLPIREGRDSLAGAPRGVGEAAAGRGATVGEAEAAVAPKAAPGATAGVPEAGASEPKVPVGSHVRAVEEAPAVGESVPERGVAGRASKTLEGQIQAMEQRLDALSDHPDAPIMRRDLDSLRRWASEGREQEAGALLKSLSKRVEAAKLSRGAGMLTPVYHEAEEAAGLRVIEYRPEAGRVPVQLDATSPASLDETGQRLLEHVRRAIHQFEEEGLTSKQTEALKLLEKRGRSTLYDAYRGSRIDALTKQAVMDDEALQHVYVTVNYEKGPDFFDSRTGTWYDMTTTGAWKSHVREYGAENVPGFRLPIEALP